MMDMKTICKCMFFFGQQIPLGYEYVLMVQDKSVLYAARCNFTDNDAVYGGAIFVWVSTTNQLPDKFY